MSRKQKAIAILNARRPAEAAPSMSGGGAPSPSPAAPPVAAQPVAQRFAHVIERRKAGKK